ncbi:hypothetical protein TNCV_137841 [Trichonephila clavipes]|nr:hypothetical protein TNCV_137841 [Trichonephila clavipes]
MWDLLDWYKGETGLPFDQLTPTLSVPTDGVVSRVFIESSAQEQVVDLHSGMAADWACFVSSRLNSGGLLPKSPVQWLGEIWQQLRFSPGPLGLDPQ